MAKNNAQCSICGRDYYMCSSCEDKTSLYPWKMFCDTALHFQVFQVIRGYNTGVYTKEEAKDKFKNINLDDIESFRPHIKQIVEDIMFEQSPVTEVLADKDLATEKVAVSRKRKYKTVAE